MKPLCTKCNKRPATYGGKLPCVTCQHREMYKNVYGKRNHPTGENKKGFKAV